jgi:catechol 2,3-dioxygenase-like lactoylglutathione lyase family enzyme
MLLYSPQPDELRAVLRDVFGWDHVEDSPGWLIFELPPAELAVHPSEGAKHELSLMCDDIEATVSELRAKGIEFRDEPQERRFGIATTMVLPGGVEVLLYEPRHASPLT